MTDDPRFFWCLTHKTVEEGEHCRAQDRLGPYDTAEAARNWKSTHEAREEKWEDDDERWAGEQDPS